MHWNFWIQTSQTGDQLYVELPPYGEHFDWLLKFFYYQLFQCNLNSLTIGKKYPCEFLQPVNTVLKYNLFTVQLWYTLAFPFTIVRKVKNLVHFLKIALG